KYGFFVLILVLVSVGFFIRNYHYFGTPTCYVIPIKSLAVFDTSGCSINLFQPKYQFGGRVAPTGTEQSVYSIGITSYLDFAYGNVFFVTFAFLTGMLILVFRRDKITDFLLLYFILFLALFPLITGRAEDTARYTLGWVFLIALFAGRFFDELYEFLKKYLKQFAIVIFVMVIALSYLNLQGKLDIMFRVKQFSPAFFEACDWVKNNLPKDVSLYTVWSHRAIYNCQRNAIGTTTASDIALSKDVNYTLALAKELGITHLFIQKFSIDPQNNHYAENYDLDWVQFLEDNPQAFVRVYENGLNFDLTNRSVWQWANYCYQRIGSICDGNVIYELNYTY
ncbi:MAG: hypothetical protein QMD14_05330, partial [Candidatus Aenigmarchaeota archaeon]|nr:hypothetical protein [Candidatus Aenigmarchaeota archaeon]